MKEFFRNLGTGIVILIGLGLAAGIGLLLLMNHCSQNNCFA